MEKHIARHHMDIIDLRNKIKTLIVFSHVEQPTTSQTIIGRGNEEVLVNNRENPASLELNPLLWRHANSYEYQLLSTVSIFILGKPATSVPCEIDTTQRSSLRPIQVDFLKRIFMNGSLTEAVQFQYLILQTLFFLLLTRGSWPNRPTAKPPPSILPSH